MAIFNFVGPGCSSVGYGAAVELGPLKVDENGFGLLFNNFSWITGHCHLVCQCHFSYNGVIYP